MRHLASVFLFFSFIFSSLPAQGETLGFTQNEFSYELKIGSQFKIELSSLLTVVPSEKPQWKTDNLKPAWLTLDAENGVLQGTVPPGASSESTFRLFVQSGEAGAITQIKLQVLSLPEWTQSPLDLGLQKEGSLFVFNLNDFVTDPTGGTLRFEVQDLPSWLSLSPDGTLRGTPARKDVGSYKGITITALSVAGKAEVAAYGEVLKTIRPPSWTQSPVKLSDALEDASYSTNIEFFVNNPENTALEFEMVTTKSWLSVSKKGELFGTPRAGQVGDHSILIRFRTEIDGQVFQKTNEFKITVLDVNHPPRWINDPIGLPAAWTLKSYSQSLQGSATDPDPQDTLTFSLISGPSWLQVNPDGSISGTPTNADVGLAKFKVQVSDGTLSAQAELQIPVNKSNEPPVWLQSPVVLKDAKEDSSYGADLNQYVSDPDGDPLTFTFLGSSNWAQITNQGAVSGLPRRADVGLHKFQVRVSDNVSGNAIVDVIVRVERTNHAPQWILNPVYFRIDAESVARLDLSPYATDSDVEDTLSFQKVSGPSWAQVDSSGILEGTPLSSDVGTSIFVVRVTDSEGLSELTHVHVEVLPINHPPEWTKNPIVLENAKERQPYQAGLAQYAKDVDVGDTLRFLKVSGPAWAEVSAEGIFSGTPDRKHLGINVFQVRVLDAAQESALVRVEINVEKVNLAPRWRQTPVSLNQSFEDKAYSFSLERYATDPDGDELTFRIVSGPAWITVTPQGMLSGTPQRADVGQFELELEVSDGVAVVTNKALGMVVATNHPPVAATPLISFTVLERENFEFNLNSGELISDPDGDELHFSLMGGKEWMELSDQGVLVASPLHSHLGRHEATIRVHDNDLYVEVPLEIIVERDPQYPVWNTDPVVFEIRTNEVFETDISSYVSDLDGVALTLSSEDLPSWASLTPSGTLAAKPSSSDVGETSSTLIATNDGLSSEATLIFKVVIGTQTDSLVLETMVPGAKVETVWVVDTSKWSYSLMDGLRSSLHYYKKVLEKYKVDHTGVFLSPDYGLHQARPIEGQGVLLSHTNPEWTADFFARTQSAFSLNCLNTPTWTLQKLYDNYFESGVEGFFEPFVPSEVFIVTTQQDHYPEYTSQSPYAFDTARDFANRFSGTHGQKNKPYRISAVAPHCPKLTKHSEPSEKSASSQTYKELVQSTGGTFYASDCGVNWPDLLTRYATQVAWRAHIAAKKSLKLSQVPLDINTLVVRIGDRILQGNEGSSKDLWRFNAQDNTISFYWDRIGIHTVSQKDVLVVEYRVS